MTDPIDIDILDIVALGSAALPGLLGGLLLAVAVVLDRLRPEAL